MKSQLTVAGVMEIHPENSTEEFALRMWLGAATDPATKNWRPGAVVVVMTDDMARAEGLDAWPKPSGTPDFSRPADYKMKQSGTK